MEKTRHLFHTGQLASPKKRFTSPDSLYELITVGEKQGVSKTYWISGDSHCTCLMTIMEPDFLLNNRRGKINDSIRETC